MSTLDADVLDLAVSFLGFPLDSFFLSLDISASVRCALRIKHTKASLVPRRDHKADHCAEAANRAGTIYNVNRCCQVAAMREGAKMRGILLWVIGIPIPVIILLYILS